jgi:hypothetical protein
MDSVHKEDSRKILNVRIWKREISDIGILRHTETKGEEEEDKAEEVEKE